MANMVSTASSDAASTSYHTAMDLNNGGVAFLQSGRYAEAVRVLGQALKRVRSSSASPAEAATATPGADVTSNVSAGGGADKNTNGSPTAPHRRLPASFNAPPSPGTRKNLCRIAVRASSTTTSSSSCVNSSCPTTTAATNSATTSDSVGGSGVADIACSVVTDGDFTLEGIDGSFRQQQQQQQQQRGISSAGSSTIMFFPIQFQQNDGTENANDDADSNYDVAIVLYNLAVAFYCAAKSSSACMVETRRRTKKSIHLFQLSQSLLMQLLAHQQQQQRSSIRSPSVSDQDYYEVAWLQLSKVLHTTVLVLQGLFQVLSESTSDDAEREAARLVEARLTTLQRSVRSLERQGVLFQRGPQGNARINAVGTFAPAA